jgi:hypothetical protein
MRVPVRAVLAVGGAWLAAACTVHSDVVARSDAGPEGSDSGGGPADGGGGSCAPVDPPPGTTVMTLDTAGPGGALALGAVCDPAVNQCAPGTLCCTACCVPGTAPVCTAPDVTGACPLPDVSIDEAMLAGSFLVDFESFDAASCSIGEGCIDAPGTRRLLHFGIQLPNTGTADLHIGVPSPDNDNFEWSDCHGHYHFAAYGQYRLLTLDGCEAARGHKNGFCVLDLAPYTAGAGPGQYGCGDMGISVGWSDIYGVGTGCQWVDITDVPAGDYLLEAIVNPEWALAESNYDNNVVVVPVTIDDPGPPPGPDDITGPCTTSQTGLSRDCGWTVDGVYPCTAGAPLSVGCNDVCTTPLGACTGDAMLRACIGPDNVCPAATALASSDDACGTYCPYLTTTCPATGTITVLSAPFTSGDAYTCTVMVQ